MNSCQTVPLSPWSSVAIVFTALGALMFVIGYARTTRGAWRHTMIGLNVMALVGSILVVSLLGVATVVWGIDWPHKNEIRSGAWTVIGGIIWWRVVILYRVQHRDREADQQ